MSASSSTQPAEAGDTGRRARVELLLGLYSDAIAAPRWAYSLSIRHDERFAIVGLALEEACLASSVQDAAPGVTPATPLTGWSMTKSVTNAILGVLVRNGKLDMQRPAPIAEWSAPGDPRRLITGDQLLRMVSGIRCVQSLETGFTTLFDADTQMEYDMADQWAFAPNAGLRAKPGTEWRYTTAISYCCRG